MRRLRSTLAVCLLAGMPGLPAFAGNDAPADTPKISCGSGEPGAINCVPSKEDLKQARSAYNQAVKLQDRKHLEESFAKFDRASRLVPRDPRFLSAREMTKAQLVFQHTERGDAFLADAQREHAAAEFRAALELDPDNAYTQQRLADSLRDPSAPAIGGMAALLADSSEIHLQPNSEQATFHYRGDVRGLFTELASAYGMTAEFDDSVQSKAVRFFVDDVDFFTALRLACRVSKTMWTALDAHQLLIAADSPENHKQFDRMSLVTFTVPGATTPQQATELVTSLRNICDFQKITSGQDRDRRSARPAGHARGLHEVAAPIDQRSPAGVARCSGLPDQSHLHPRNRHAHSGHFQHVQHPGGSSGGAGRAEHYVARQSTDFFRRHQRRRKFGSVRASRATAKPD